jgi:hypothetical protein
VCEEHTHESVGEEEEGKRRRREREGVGSRQGSREIVGDVWQPETGSTRRFAAVRPITLSTAEPDSNMLWRHAIAASTITGTSQLLNSLRRSMPPWACKTVTICGREEREGGVGEIEGEMLAGVDGV